MSEPALNHWIGKSAEAVLAESYHEIREPITLATGYLNILRSADHLSLTAEQTEQYIELAFHYVLRAQTIVESVYEYMNEKRKNPE
jgi:hypothetical protein